MSVEARPGTSSSDDRYWRSACSSSPACWLASAAKKSALARSKRSSTKIARRSHAPMMRQGGAPLAGGQARWGAGHGAGARRGSSAGGRRRPWSRPWPVAAARLALPAHVPRRCAPYSDDLRNPRAAARRARRTVPMSHPCHHPPRLDARSHAADSRLRGSARRPRDADLARHLHLGRPGSRRGRRRPRARAARPHPHQPPQRRPPDRARRRHRPPDRRGDGPRRRLLQGQERHAAHLGRPSSASS